MTKAQAKRHVLAALRKWRRITGTDRWTVSLQWEDTDNELDGVAAGCVAHREYHTADITFDLERIRRSYNTANSISYLVLHELSHCLHFALIAAAELKVEEPFAKHIVEDSATMIARAIWVAYHRGKEPPDED